MASCWITVIFLCEFVKKLMNKEIEKKETIQNKFAINI